MNGVFRAGPFYSFMQKWAINMLPTSFGDAFRAGSFHSHIPPPPCFRRRAVVLDPFPDPYTPLCPASAVQGWNHIIFDGGLPLPTDVMVHITWPLRFPKQTKESNCSDSVYRKGAERECKYLGLEHYINEVIGTKQYKKDLDFKAAFVEEKNGCQQV